MITLNGETSRPYIRTSFVRLVVTTDINSDAECLERKWESDSQ